MAVKVKLAAKPKARTGFGLRLLRAVLVLILIVAVAGAGIFAYFYFKYQRVVDDRLAAGPIFANVSQIYAAPREIRVGQHLTASAVANDLRQAGYNANPKLGTYQLTSTSILIKPGPESYHATDGATIVTAPAAIAGNDVLAPTDYVVQSITDENGVALAAYQLEPQLITALSEDKNRTKRRLVAYKDIPPRMVEAVVAIEDRDFFQHGGINYARTAKCAVVDILSHHMSCGGSTITQQLARGFFLSPDKKLTRKMAEIMITFQLEARFSKQQIFEMYANQMNLGHIGSYEINGFGEAAQAFFGKNLGQLDSAECALLAALLQNPSYRNPYRHPERAMERRNLVLDSMVETHAISATEATRAKAEPLHLVTLNVDASEAPYFVDLVHEQLVKRISDQDLGHSSLRIYTSLDPDLQLAATQAVDVGMKEVDELIRKRHKKGETEFTYPQVALVAINPHTGQLLALVGGRNYGTSQLNHAVAERPTGSSFKPFVYATAYNTSLNGTDLDGTGVFTALTKLNDDETDFGTPDKPYQPGNMVRGEFPGMVPAVVALAHSLNIATISLAQQVGYENVAALARSAGIVNVRPTPSMAIGTYNASPLDMAGAYTVFANGGVKQDPWMLASVRNPAGDIVADYAPTAKQIMDPRAAYLTQSLLENVMTFGTAAGVRSRGFTAPAAGKTGTEHDAWFIGYSSNLLCAVWVGNDDYTDISHGLTHSLQGADTAAPIWAEFMKRAIQLPQYSDMKAFTPPSGVDILKIDKNSWLPSDNTCPVGYYVAFLNGTAPNGTCSHMGEAPPSFQSSSSPPSRSPSSALVATPAAGTAPPNTVTLALPPSPPQPADTTDTPDQPAHKKRNIFQKIFGTGKDKAAPTPE